MTSPAAVARMLARVERRARMGQARSAQVRFNSQGIPDLITFADGSSTPPLFVTHTATLLPGGASPAGRTLPMLVVPLDGGGWVPVAYMPLDAGQVVETTIALPVQTIWQKATPETMDITWEYQRTNVGAAAVGRQGWQYDPNIFGDVYPDATFVAICHFGLVATGVPSGATVHSVKLALTRRQTAGPPGSPVSPVVSGHTYTPAAPPTAGTPPAFATGRRVTGAPMAPGQSQQVDLWATDLLTGAITGIALGNNPNLGEPVAGGADFDGLQLLVTYTGGLT